MKGNPKVIAVLQAAIKGELAASQQYLIHSMLLDNSGYVKLAKHELAEVKDERKHLARFMDRLVFLDGIPETTIGPVHVGKSLKAILEADLKAEMTAVADYSEAREVCRAAKDYTTMRIFEATLADEEEHVNFLETQLNLLAAIGQQAYGQLQADD